ncbi:(2Fe-2S)-binding protein [Thermomicrobium sp. 4228-Ro]|uniref:(2Fe-2S)-binding protein n=1 Tax=Thermomicrobium sp. 4228-Ro TaxID=2993937 RepID=UPI002248B8F6|nr:(2Fe-2S)-binding protein [Thermomicrobium sp. 4228-Ro]MCX2728026.1 (2Fe-2S)-binding protein [Thermomicrobium sp. 4228-Ro]
MQRVTISLTVNGQPVSAEVDARMTLADFLRDQLGLTGTKLGCEHGVCGSCTVLWDGAAVRSCLALAAQADGATITTIEGLATDSTMHPVQRAFWEEHALQCGFCTPGMVLTAVALLQENPAPSEAEIREALSGNLCRCTGYQNIVRAVQIAAERMQSDRGS